MQYSHILFSIFKIKVILLVLILTQSCDLGEKESVKACNYESIYNYFNTVHNFKLKPNIKKIFVVTENGCMSCNKKFSKTITNNLEDTTSLFLITASGMLVDISYYKNKNNVFFDNALDYTKYPYFSNTKAIYLKESKIDTIINIEAKQFNNGINSVIKRK